MSIVNVFILVGSLLGIVVIAAMAILPSLWEFDASRPDRPPRGSRSGPPPVAGSSPPSPRERERGRHDFDRAA